MMQFQNVLATSRLGSCLHVLIYSCIICHCAFLQYHTVYTCSVYLCIFIFIRTGILEVLYCVLIESPEVLNIIQENHIKSIISLLDKHGRNHKVRNV